MYRNYNTDSQLTKTMTEDQFDQVVGAISSGKYSWACLLILRFAGYNPLHYIPHRTYNRLMKSYRENKLERVEEIPVMVREGSGRRKSSKSSQKLRDLAYLKEIDRPLKRIKGGARVFPLGFLPNFATGSMNYVQKPTYNHTDSFSLGCWDATAFDRQ